MRLLHAQSATAVAASLAGSRTLLWAGLSDMHCSLLHDVFSSMLSILASMASLLCVVALLQHVICCTAVLA